MAVTDGWAVPRKVRTDGRERGYWEWVLHLLVDFAICCTYLIKNKSDFDDTEDEDAMKWATRGSSTGRPSSSVRWMSAAEIAESKLLCSSSDGWTGSWWRLGAHLRHSIITVHSRFPDYLVFGGLYEK